jgi:hypothetical protein
MMIEHRILEFLDGKLGTADEEELLHTLAVSPERRGLLRQHMRTRELTQSLVHDPELAVPCTLTSSLFAKLAEQGLTAGPAGVLATQITPITIGLSSGVGVSSGFVAAEAVAPVASGYRTASVALIALLAFFIGIGSFALFNSALDHGNSTFASSNSATNNSASNASQTIANAISPNVSVATSDNRAVHANNFHDVMRTRIPRDAAPAVQGFAISRNSAHVRNSVGRSNDADVSTVGSIAEVQQIRTSEMPVGDFDFGKQKDLIGSDLIVPPLRYDGEVLDPNTIPLAFSIRTGAGPVPTSTRLVSGSLSEIKLSWYATSWLVAKVFAGEFLPYETSGKPLGSASGVLTIGAESALQFKHIAGAELGIRFTPFHFPIELSGGIAGDFAGNFFPRAGLFTNFSLTDRMSVNVGVEGMLYNHDISPSIDGLARYYKKQNPAVLDHLSSESSGFIGPSIEFLWHL